MDEALKLAYDELYAMPANSRRGPGTPGGAGRRLDRAQHPRLRRELSLLVRILGLLGHHQISWLIDEYAAAGEGLIVSGPEYFLDGLVGECVERHAQCLGERAAVALRQCA
jgi:hypothetical protein